MPLNKKELLEEIDPVKMPAHIAIIMDGNGRWAKKRRLPRVAGHVAGAHRVTEIVQAAVDLKIKVLSLYAFSTENWSRPKEEISALMKLLVKFLKSQIKNLIKGRVKLIISGNLETLPDWAREVVYQSIEKTKNNPGLVFNLCLNYGGRQEIVDTCRKVTEAVTKNQLKIENLNENSFGQFLYHPETENVDLMIRTSGEERISNFLLWQLAYSELYFTPVLWPDFTKIDLLKAIMAYQKRERRFGGI